ncbi:hypothetical protein SJ05684_b42000 (plasmid) [Sinorhizobium sojae CCBAU 05684]|uniref:SCP2 domain-containing protein n=1 Tax=Sinorhizobium sojae CCBAU 05684 TaxID=716928 RepID=A0A249PHG6_9HYPH|nr:hypothetical protein [Sinorhizobium sojae]ASY65182.1 hypothetical protein SJ05684_b42000 [Sinorhizobium sojae CCBAU 05684]
MHRRACISRLLLPLSLLAATLSPSASSACGYHDDVMMARGLLNWVYPDALHVLGSISAAVAERRLPPPSSAGAAPDLFGANYRKTVRSLEQFGRNLPLASGEKPPPSVSLVLIEPMLWTRFEMGTSGLHMRVHVTGPEPEDVVLVSGEAVIAEIASGGLTIGKAHELGLIRLYGPAAKRALFLLAYARAEARPSKSTTPAAVAKTAIPDNPCQRKTDMGRDL